MNSTSSNTLVPANFVDLSGTVAYVTGGSRGIGRGCALEMARAGAAVIVHGLSADHSEATANDIIAAGGKAIAVFGAVDEIATHEKAIAAGLAAFGRIDHLVTSAGIQVYGDIVTTTPDVWDRVFNVNVKGTYLAAHCAAPEIRKNGAGSISLISSVQGVANQDNVAAYVSTKGALNALCRGMAVDEAKYNVRVNSVLPGSVDTPMLRNSAAEWSDGTSDGIEATIANWGTAHALGRVAQPSEVGQVVAFLASKGASFVTGAEIRVDGGLLCRIGAALPD